MATLNRPPIELSSEAALRAHNGQLRSILKRTVNIQELNRTEAGERRLQTDRQATFARRGRVPSSEDEDEGQITSESDAESDDGGSGTGEVASHSPRIERFPSQHMRGGYAAKSSNRMNAPQIRGIASPPQPRRRSITPPRGGARPRPSRGRAPAPRGGGTNTSPRSPPVRPTSPARSETDSEDDFHSMDDPEAKEDERGPNEDISDVASNGSSEGGSSVAVDQGSDAESDGSPEEESDGRTKATSFSGRDAASGTGDRLLGMSREVETRESDSEDDSSSDMEGAYPGGSMNQNWFAVEKARSEVRAVREAMQRTRRKLVKSREEKTSTDNAFMQLIRPLLVADEDYGDTIDIRALNSRFEAMQQSRTNYQTIEQEYEALEHRLEQAELELERVEKSFFSVVYEEDPFRLENALDNLDLDEAGSIRSRETLRGIPPAREQDIHPTYMQLMNTAAKLSGAREALDDVRTQRESLQDWEETQRKIVEHNPHDKDRHENLVKLNWPEQLKESLAEEDELLEDISRLERRRDELKRLCLENNLMPEFQPINELWDLEMEVDHLQDDITISVPSAVYWRRNGRTKIIVSGTESERQALAHPQFSILLSNPSHLLSPGCPPTSSTMLKEARKLPKDDPTRGGKIGDAYKETSIERLIIDTPDSDKNQFINRWLLQRLRTSPFEVDVMYNTFSRTVTINNTLRWQADVLFFWSRDEGNHEPSEFVTAGSQADSWERSGSADDKVGSQSSRVEPSGAEMSGVEPSVDARDGWLGGNRVSRRVQFLKTLRPSSGQRLARRYSFSSFQGFEAYRS